MNAKRNFRRRNEKGAVILVAIILVVVAIVIYGGYCLYLKIRQWTGNGAPTATEAGGVVEGERALLQEVNRQLTEVTNGGFIGLFPKGGSETIRYAPFDIDSSITNDVTIAEAQTSPDLTNWTDVGTVYIFRNDLNRQGTNNPLLRTDIRDAVEKWIAEKESGTSSLVSTGGPPKQPIMFMRVLTSSVPAIMLQGPRSPF